MTRNIIVFTSTNGGLLKHLLDNQENLNFKITSIISDRECGAKKIAKEYDVDFTRMKSEKINNLKFLNCDLIITAGYLSILPRKFIVKNPPIINTHPSLLPKYGGRGMYGGRVHEAVIKANEKITGCTAHYIDEGIDTGEIICQSEVSVNENDSAWELGLRVWNAECINLLNAIKIFFER